MAVEGPQPVNWTFTVGVTAVEAFTFVKLSAANTVIPCASATDKPIGVAQEAAAAGGAVAVCVIGITKVLGDANLGYGNAIGTSDDGRAAAYTASDTTKYIVGTVLIDNAADEGVATAVINCANARRLANP